jgi:hypothetical protein
VSAERNALVIYGVGHGSSCQARHLQWQINEVVHKAAGTDIREKFVACMLKHWHAPIYGDCSYVGHVAHSYTVSGPRD